jgi:hypothetical protein
MDKERFIAVWLPKILNIFGLKKTYEDIHIRVMSKNWDDGYSAGLNEAFKKMQELKKSHE